MFCMIQQKNLFLYVCILSAAAALWRTHGPAGTRLAVLHTVPLTWYPGAEAAGISGAGRCRATTATVLTRAVMPGWEGHTNEITLMSLTYTWKCHLSVYPSLPTWTNYISNSYFTVWMCHLSIYQSQPMWMSYMTHIATSQYRCVICLYIRACPCEQAIHVCIIVTPQQWCVICPFANWNSGLVIHKLS